MTAKLSISTIIGVPNDKNLEIVDQFSNIYLGNCYNDLGQMIRKSWVVDLDTNQMLFELDTIERTTNFPNVDGDITIGIEGTTINVFKYNGKIFLMTSRHLDGMESGKWGTNLTFKELYEKSGAPPFEMLFKGNTSTFVYQFLISAPHLKMVSKEMGKVDYVVYLGHIQMKINFEDELFIFAVEKVKNSIMRKTNFIQFEKLLPSDFPNHYEFFIVKHPKLKISYIVESLQYNFRRNIKGDDPNFLRRFCTLLYQSNTMSEETFSSNYVYHDLKSNTVESLTELFSKHYIIYFDITTDHSLFMNENQRMMNIYINFMMSLSSFIVKEAVNILMNYVNLKKDLLVMLYDKKALTKRMGQIISQSEKYPDYKGSINHLIKKERPDSLYQMLTSINFPILK